MNEYITGALSQVEKAAIKTFYYEDKTEKQIGKLLNRSPKSKVLSNYLKKLSEEEDVDVEKNQMSENLEEWKDVIAETVKELVKSGVNVENAQALVKDAIDKVDLESTPSVNTLKSFAMANSTKMPLTQMKKWGRSSIVSATEASSTSADQTKGSRVLTRKEQGAVYSPNPNKG